MALEVTICESVGMVLNGVQRQSLPLFGVAGNVVPEMTVCESSGIHVSACQCVSGGGERGGIHPVFEVIISPKQELGIHPLPPSVMLFTKTYQS